VEVVVQVPFSALPKVSAMGSVTPGMDAVTLSAGSFAKLRYRTLKVNTVAVVPDIGLTTGLVSWFGAGAPASTGGGAAASIAQARINAVRAAVRMG
jgi:hypothetical protein